MLIFSCYEKSVQKAIEWRINKWGGGMKCQFYVELSFNLGYYWSRCLRIHSAIFIKLSDSASTLAKAWLFPGYQSNREVTP